MIPNIRKTKAIILLVLGLQLLSCSKGQEVDDLFDKSAKQRFAAQKELLNKELESAQYGWKFVYFPDKSQIGGFTFFCKFENGVVKMTSDFYAVDSRADRIKNLITDSEYNIKIGSTTSLVFTTKNQIHYLSDGDNAPNELLEGKGYKGDFQFNYYGKDGEDLLFRTSRDFIEIRFTKATKDDMPEQYVEQNLDRLASLFIDRNDPNAPMFQLFETTDEAGNKEIYGTNILLSSRFINLNSLSNPDVVLGRGFSLTPNSISFGTPLVVGGKELSNFVYDPATNELVATNGKTKGRLFYSKTPLDAGNLFETLLPGKPEVAYTTESLFLRNYNVNSAKFFNILLQTQIKLPYLNQLANIEFHFNEVASGGISYIKYKATYNPSATLYQLITVERKGTDKVVFKSLGWKDTLDPAAGFVTRPDALQGLDEQITDPNGVYFRKEQLSYVFKGRVVKPYWSITNENNLRIAVAIIE